MTVEVYSMRRFDTTSAKRASAIVFELFCTGFTSRSFISHNQ